MVGVDFNTTARSKEGRVGAGLLPPRSGHSALSQDRLEQFMHTHDLAAPQTFSEHRSEDKLGAGQNKESFSPIDFVLTSIGLVAYVWRCKRTEFTKYDHRPFVAEVHFPLGATDPQKKLKSEDLVQFSLELREA